MQFLFWQILPNCRRWFTGYTPTSRVWKWHVLLNPRPGLWHKGVFFWTWPEFRASGLTLLHGWCSVCDQDSVSNTLFHYFPFQPFEGLAYSLNRLFLYMCFLIAQGTEGGADVSVPGFWRCGSIDLKVNIGGSLPPLNKQTEVLTFKAEYWWCHIVITSPLSYSLC